MRSKVKFASVLMVMMLSLVIVIHRHYGTTDVRDVRRLRE